MSYNEMTNIILDDLSYISDEMLALKRVIQTIPYDVKLGQFHSLLEVFHLIDYAQTKQFRNSVLSGDDEGEFGSNFDSSKYSTSDVMNIIDDVIKNRNELIDLLKVIKKNGIVKYVHQNGQILTLNEYCNSLIRYERNLFKKSAELILSMEVKAGK